MTTLQCFLRREGPGQMSPGRGRRDVAATEITDACAKESQKTSDLRAHARDKSQGLYQQFVNMKDEIEKSIEKWLHVYYKSMMVCSRAIFLFFCKGLIHENYNP